jgi:hypothetical protein
MSQQAMKMIVWNLMNAQDEKAKGPAVENYILSFSSL